MILKGTKNTVYGVVIWLIISAAIKQVRFVLVKLHYHCFSLVSKTKYFKFYEIKI